VVAEIADFYESRGLSPRVNYVSAEGDHSGLREALRAAGFTFSSENPRLYLFRNPSRILPNPLVRVRLVPAVDSDLLTSLASINNMRMAKVLQRRAVRPDGWLFVAEIDGEPAAVALLERLGDIARVDEVHTAERYRGKGCARTVIHTLVAYYQAHLNIPLFLWTYNPIAERIYIEAGFYKLDNPPAIWYTWRERK